MVAALAGVGFWLSRLSLLGVLWPLGTAFYAALRSWPYAKPASVAVLLAVAAGAGLSGGWEVALAQGTACLLYEGMGWGSSPARGLTGRALPFAVAALSFAGIYLGSSPGMKGVWLLGAHVLLSWFLAAAFQQAKWLVPFGQGAPVRLCRVRQHEAVGAWAAHSVARLRALARLLKELSASFREAGATEEPLPPEEEAAMLVNRLSAAVCHGCALFDRCWGEGFSERYRLALELLAAAEEGKVDSSPVVGAWEKGCQRHREIRLVALHLTDVRQVERRWRRRLGEQRDLLTGHLQGLADALEELAQVTGEPRPYLRRGQVRSKPLLYVTEVAKLARPGRLVSGDSHLIKELAGHRLLLVLSDGMGTGHRAAAESRETVRLVERLLDAGFDIRTVVRLANSILALRSPEETFATLDLALIDLVSGEAEFVKVGAAPTFIYQRGGVGIVRARSLPLGILDSVEVESVRRRLGSGDVIVMVTDGLLEGWGDQAVREGQVERVIREGATAPYGAEQSLARALLEDVALGLSEERQDDMTVLVVRLWSEERGNL